ncbi:hypothetical protein DOY81_004007, partial [Sarcophaga bullata]
SDFLPLLYWLCIAMGLITSAPLQNIECNITCPPNNICVGENTCACVQNINSDKFDPLLSQLPHCDSDGVGNDEKFDEEMLEELFTADSDETISEIVTTNDDIQIGIETSTEFNKVNNLSIEKYTNNFNRFYEIFGVACIIMAFLILIACLRK